MHSNLAGVLQFYNKSNKEASEKFILYLKKYLGKNGVLIIPTYNYEFTKDKIFNIEKSISEVGFFSNYLIKKNYKRRTLDPIFSHLIFGKIKNFNLKQINSEAFGNKSLFSYFKKNNFKIFCFCCSTNSITYIHYIETLLKVPYRYLKKFTGTFKNNNSKVILTYKYNVGKKKYDYSLKEKKINKLINQKNFIKTYFGKFECYSVTCNYLYSSLKKKINSNKKFLII